MKVFISWSGDHSRQLAEAIQWWLQHVLQFTKPFFSPEDIDKGKRWDNEISKQLGQSQIGIITMTEENLTSPWIMFEAGAISKVVEEREGLVCSIVFGIKPTDLIGPLKSFQVTAFNKDEVRKLLKTINKVAKEAALPEQSLDEQFDMWWPRLEEKVEAIMSTQPQTEPQRDQRDLLEEAVSNTRTILRELQVPRPLQVFAPSREMEAFVEALMKPHRGLGADPVGDKARAEMAGAAALPYSLTPKSE
jgi:TIR domain